MSDWCEMGHEKGQRGCALCEELVSPTEVQIGRRRLPMTNAYERIAERIMWTTGVQVALGQEGRIAVILREELRPLVEAAGGNIVQRILQQADAGAALTYGSDCQTCKEIGAFHTALAPFKEGA